MTNLLSIENVVLINYSNSFRCVLMCVCGRLLMINSKIYSKICCVDVSLLIRMFVNLNFIIDKFKHQFIIVLFLCLIKSILLNLTRLCFFLFVLFEVPTF